jgi:hypothetical protein
MMAHSFQKLLLFIFVIQEIANDHDDHEERHLDLGVEIHDKTISNGLRFL